VSSLGVFFDLIIVVIFIIIFTIIGGVVVPRPRVLYYGKRKRRVDDGLGGQKPIEVFISRWRSSK
jgi:hypothetical protein